MDYNLTHTHLHTNVGYREGLRCPLLFSSPTSFSLSLLTFAFSPPLLPQSLLRTSFPLYSHISLLPPALKPCNLGVTVTCNCVSFLCVSWRFELRSYIPLISLSPSHHHLPLSTTHVTQTHKQRSEKHSNVLHSAPTFQLLPRRNFTQLPLGS